MTRSLVRLAIVYEYAAVVIVWSLYLAGYRIGFTFT